MKKYVLIAGFIALLFIPSVLADYPERWDSYTSGTASPGPWTLTTTMSSCWTGTQAMALSPPSFALSEPNVYSFSGASTAGCFTTTHNANISAPTNATSNVVAVSFYYNVFTSAASNSTSYTFSLYICGTLAASGSPGHTSSYWIHVSASETSTIGSLCHISFILATVGAGTPHVVALGIDNVQITGANIITTGANFFLINAQTDTWFNIAGYKNSYIIVAFPSGPPVYYYNVTIPDLVINTAGASLVTVWVGQSYFVTIIPAQSGNNFVFLNPPNSPVLTYTLAIQDLSGVFNPGTQVYVYQGNRVMFSGYSDAQNSMGLWMVSGSYRVLLQSGANSYSTTLNFPSINGATVIVQILKETFTNRCGTTCTVSTDAGFNPARDHVIVIFNDTGLLTTSITDSIWIKNSSGTFLLYSASHSGTFGTLQDSVSCASQVCNVANASQMYVQIDYHGGDGSDSINLPLTGGGFFALPFSLPQNLLGWDVIFPSGSATPVAFIGYAIIIACASIWGVFSARFGAVVTTFVAGALAYAGFIPIAPGAITLLIAMGVMQFIASLERS